MLDLLLKLFENLLGKEALFEAAVMVTSLEPVGMMSCHAFPFLYFFPIATLPIFYMVLFCVSKE